MNEPRQLMRSDNRIFGGVCGGIAEHFNWDPSQVRLGYVLLSVLSAGFPGTLVYLILWIALPEKARAR